MHPFGPKIFKFSRGRPPDPPSGRRQPPPTPTPTCHYVARNGGRAAILVPLTLEKVPVTKNLNKNPVSVCLTSNKLYWIEDQLADVSTQFYTSASWRW